jgi:hypothetical protein
VWRKNAGYIFASLIIMLCLQVFSTVKSYSKKGIFTKKKCMESVYSDIEIINGEDLILAKRSIIRQEEIKRMSINILVDTGYYYLCINETIQE